MRLWLAMVLALFVGACGGGKERPSAAPEAVSEPGVASAAASDGDGKWGGWRWKGKRDRCFFIHGGHCFDEQKDACAAARCGNKKCMSNDSAPAKVYCEGSPPPTSN